MQDAADPVPDAPFALKRLYVNVRRFRQGSDSHYVVRKRYRRGFGDSAVRRRNRVVVNAFESLADSFARRFERLYLHPRDEPYFFDGLGFTGVGDSNG